MSRNTCRPAMRGAIALLMLAMATSASAQAEGRSGEAETEQEIVVIGLKDPFTLKSKQVNEMLAAFYDKRATYAPRARLFVELKDLGDGLSEDTRFVLRGKGQEHVLPIDESKRIYFPDTKPIGGPFELASNVSKTRVGVALWVMSPGTKADSRTIGDLRLQCEVMWAAAKSTVSPIVRSMFGAAGACKSKRIAFYFRSAKPLSSGTVTTAGKSIPIQVGANHLAYRAPIWDKSVPNSATVKLVFD